MKVPSEWICFPLLSIYEAAPWSSLAQSRLLMFHSQSQDAKSTPDISYRESFGSMQSDGSVSDDIGRVANLLDAVMLEDAKVSYII